MDGVGAGDLGGGNDARDIELGLSRARRADANVVIGEADVQRFAIGGGVYRNGFDAKLAARADDPERDLAPVCDQNFLKHGNRVSS